VPARASVHGPRRHRTRSRRSGLCSVSGIPAACFLADSGPSSETRRALHRGPMKPEKGQHDCAGIAASGESSDPLASAARRARRVSGATAEPASPSTIGAGVCSVGSEQHWYLDPAPRVWLVVEALAHSALVGEYFMLRRWEYTAEPPPPTRAGRSCSVSSPGSWPRGVGGPISALSPGRSS